MPAKKEVFKNFRQVLSLESFFIHIRLSKTEEKISCHIHFKRAWLKMATDEMDCKVKELRRIPLNVRAISAKNIYQKTTHSTVTF